MNAIAFGVVPFLEQRMAGGAVARTIITITTCSIRATCRNARSYDRNQACGPDHRQPCALGCIWYLLVRANKATTR